MPHPPARRHAVPHPFPYQGSKRAICKHILPHVPTDAALLVEPFCGSAAVSLAVAVQSRTRRFWLNDANGALMALWREILERPLQLAERYERLWCEQLEDRRGYFYRVRRQFNQTQEPHLLLYLLARIVKGSVRYSSDGRFNQSADNRRAGMRPAAMRAQLFGVSAALAARTRITSHDFRRVVADTSTDDVIYMDPPYQGTSFTRDHRYLGGLPFAEFVDALRMMNRAGKSYIVSYDGMTGAKVHGEPMPAELHLRCLSIHAGRSSQSTLLGRDCQTVESLYLSPALVERLNGQAGYAAAAGEPDVTTEELKERYYGYNHPPRAARDVREQGIPLEPFRAPGRPGVRSDRAAVRSGSVPGSAPL